MHFHFAPRNGVNELLWGRNVEVIQQTAIKLKFCVLQAVTMEVSVSTSKMVARGGAVG
jgi:hypothetical protein